ncbi:MAG: hypothetical protein ACXVA4_06145, partial [Ktedonobacterales bacterium]
GAVPAYLRVGRSSTLFIAYTSTDGVTWTVVAGSIIMLPSLRGTILQGMAVTSHRASAICTVTFDSVTVAVPTAPVAVPQALPSPSASLPTSSPAVMATPAVMPTRRKP